MEYLYINNQNSVAVTYNPESIVEDIYINGKKHDFKDEKNEIDPVQTDTTDSKYLFDNEDAIVVNFKKKKM